MKYTICFFCLCFFGCGTHYNKNLFCEDYVFTKYSFRLERGGIEYVFVRELEKFRFVFARVYYDKDFYHREMLSDLFRSDFIRYVTYIPSKDLYLIDVQNDHLETLLNELLINHSDRVIEENWSVWIGALCEGFYTTPVESYLFSTTLEYYRDVIEQKFQSTQELGKEYDNSFSYSGQVFGKFTDRPVFINSEDEIILNFYILEYENTSQFTLIDYSFRFNKKNRTGKLLVIEEYINFRRL